MIPSLGDFVPHCFAKCLIRWVVEGYNLSVQHKGLGFTYNENHVVSLEPLAQVKAMVNKPLLPRTTTPYCL